MNQQNDYQFVMIPQQLTSCLDANCNKMLVTLLGLNSILANEDGWFYRSNKDLQLDTRFSQNLVIATLDTLYQAGIIDVDCIGKGKGHRSNRIHINFESFKVYQQYSFNDIRNNPDLWIETVSYKNHYSPSYCKEEGKEIGNSLGNRIGKKVTTNTDTTDTSYTTNTTYTKETIDTKEEIYKDYSIEDFISNIRMACRKFIDRHRECNYYLNNESFKESYYEYLLKFQLYVNNNFSWTFSIDDYIQFLKEEYLQTYQEEIKTA